MMNLMTDAIGANGYFDSRYTCDIDNSSPEIRWENPPPGTVGFALIAEDPDAPHGLFTHWVIYNIPAEVRHLPAGIPPQESLPNGIRQGTNSFGKLGYAGPCPPQGDRAHRYFFKLYALSQLPRFAHRVQRDEFSRTIQPLILEESFIIGLYKKTIQKAG
jgi:Raf kinase inhibitor-like YbhB/YbcL family protein